MKLYYKGVLCRLAAYRVTGEDRPALFCINAPDPQTVLDAGFEEVHYGLWAKILTDEEAALMAAAEKQAREQHAAGG